ncbi:hypothetical protein ACWHLZ_32250 [Streptomyces chartreusis]
MEAQSSLTGDAGSGLTVVAVHGVGNGFGADVSSGVREKLRAVRGAAWTRHLTDGLGVAPENINLDFAYYADKLLPDVAEQGADPLDGLNDPLEQEMLTAWSAQLGVPADVAQGHLTIPLRQITTWVATRFNRPRAPLESSSACCSAK